MTVPADTPPLVALAAAAEHLAAGRVQEIELEWWADDDGGPERRFTVTLRGTDRNQTLQASAEAAARALGHLTTVTPPPVPDGPRTPVCPDDLSGLDDT